MRAYLFFAQWWGDWERKSSSQRVPVVVVSHEPFDLRSLSRALATELSSDERTVRRHLTERGVSDLALDMLWERASGGVGSQAMSSHGALFAVAVRPYGPTAEYDVVGDAG